MHHQPQKGADSHLHLSHAARNVQLLYNWQPAVNRKKNKYLKKIGGLTWEKNESFLNGACGNIRFGFREKLHLKFKKSGGNYND
ncbi:MAG: hypothetical protein GTN53_34975 [Candidatus Aminicenantes bacterium]|nr:hypothetical protein [Candidatus Aminicenantes bacterium]NIQ71685.1 hypothetical protein [Candidatus Aminicenantes bacterium]NIT27719.1 hypothetical protein [Candidatus Aminicenantes bacterium]